MGDDPTRRYEEQAIGALWSAARRVDAGERWIGRGEKKQFAELVDTLEQLGYRLQPVVLTEPETETGIPADFWKPIPCGHPNDPVAVWVHYDWLGQDRDVPLCHCGHALALEDGVHIEGAPGPVVPCRNCGCTTAVPPMP